MTRILFIIGTLETDYRYYCTMIPNIDLWGGGCMAVCDIPNVLFRQEQHGELLFGVIAVVVIF